MRAREIRERWNVFQLLHQYSLRVVVVSLGCAGVAKHSLVVSLIIARLQSVLTTPNATESSPSSLTVSSFTVELSYPSGNAFPLLRFLICFALYKPTLFTMKPRSTYSRSQFPSGLHDQAYNRPLKNHLLNTNIHGTLEIWRSELKEN